jgi:glutamate-1-semialdehyde aminotransferase
MLLRQGVWGFVLFPGKAGFISAAHTQGDIDEIEEAAKEVFACL